MSRPDSSKVTIVPLSIDGTLPFGFIKHLQGRCIKDDESLEKMLLNCLTNNHSTSNNSRDDSTCGDGK